MRAVLTASALIQVIKDLSGSCREVSIGFLLPMKIGDCLEGQCVEFPSELVWTHHPLLFISSPKIVWSGLLVTTKPFKAEPNCFSSI